jgi:LPS export ABC transporter protein LptC
MRLIALVALAVALLAFVTWHYVGGPASRQGPPLAPPEETDYYMRDARVQISDAAGQALYRLQAGEILHFPDESMRVRQIRLDELGGEDGIWRVDAAQGFIPAEQKSVKLTGGVTVTGDSPQGPVTLRMPELDVDLVTEKMTTQSEVTLETTDYSARAVGMEGFFKSRDITLLNNVQSEFHAN